jgi:hypothetical protein
VVRSATPVAKNHELLAMAELGSVPLCRHAIAVDAVLHYYASCTTYQNSLVVMLELSRMSGEPQLLRHKAVESLLQRRSSHFLPRALGKRQWPSSSLLHIVDDFQQAESTNVDRQRMLTREHGNSGDSVIRSLKVDE